MEDNFRNILIIISTVVIGAIFAHGLWTIRKQKNPYKLKTGKDKIDPTADDIENRNFDSGGFDRDGVGQVKVSKQMLNDDEINIQIDNANLTDELDNEISDSVLAEENFLRDDSYVDEIETFNADIFDESNDIKDDTNIKSESEDSSQAEAELLYQEPVTHAKPAKKVTEKPAKQKPSKSTLKRNQMEINFGDRDSITEDKNNQSNEGAHNLEQQIIMLSVVMPSNHQMSGAILLPSLLTLGMKYGEMNIFHRHQDNAGNGAVTFSLTNMINPGTFDLDSMETFTTKGISLFMTLPNAGDPFLVFEQMLAAAKQLAQEFGAQLLDDKRNVMTKQTEQHYVGKIREYDRQHRIASTI